MACCGGVCMLPVLRNGHCDLLDYDCSLWLVCGYMQKIPADSISAGSNVAARTFWIFLFSNERIINNNIEFICVYVHEIDCEVSS